jgi:hypothetical protein
MREIRGKNATDFTDCTDFEKANAHIQSMESDPAQPFHFPQSELKPNRFTGRF